MAKTQTEQKPRYDFSGMDDSETFAQYEKQTDKVANMQGHFYGFTVDGETQDGIDGILAEFGM